MAGGRGLRLHPLTDHNPKPLLRVGSKPMLQIILENMSEQCVSRATLILNYKSNLIQEYFGNGTIVNIPVSYIVEKEPLGTAGSLRNFVAAEDPFLLSNADVISDVQYFDMLAKHFEMGNPMITCGVALHQQQIRFGVMDILDDRLNRMREKPIESWYINAGIYIINPRCLKLIPPDGPFSMAELIDACLTEDGTSVGVYPITGSWIDVGTFEDLSRANGS